LSELGYGSMAEHVALTINLSAPEAEREHIGAIGDLLVR
jgi:hypothetical protein